ncbi:MAG TPA: DUF4340 domain-containing protein [Polyangiaceae bacterium]|nr:DUF4340 domain-containing protein [Polyangiaceae bacterium]
MALTTQQRIYIGLGVLAALGAGVYVNQKNERQEQARLTAATDKANLPEIKLAADDVDKVTKIEVKNADKPAVVLEKRGDKWFVAQPVDYPANLTNVKSMLDNLKEIKTKELIDPAAASYPEYGLDEAKAVHVVAYKGGEKAFDAYFGKSGGRGQMARKAGQDGVYAISGYSAFYYTREVKNWRDNEIVKFDDAAVNRVDLKNESGEYVFKKEDDTWSATLKNAKLERFDEAKVKDMLRAFKSLNAEDFGDNKSDAEAGLDKPAALVTITPKEGAPVKLAVGKTSTGENRYLKREGNPQTYIVSSWAAGWTVAKPDRFQKPDDKKAAGASSAGAKDDKKKN